MEDHFAAVLGQTSGEGSSAPFFASSSFAGPKPGYTFGTGAKGTGYYLDTASSGSRVKRGRSGGSSSDVDAGGPGKRAALAMAEADALDGAALLAAAEKRAAQGAGGEEAPAIEFDLDEAGLKQLALRFEKQITTNQRQRVKFADQPEKFLESEMALDFEIKRLYAVAASPELYPVMVQLGTVRSLLGLLAHDNTDVSLAVVGLLVELTDSDTGEEAPDDMGQLVDALIQNQALELLIQNLGRLDDSGDSAHGSGGGGGDDAEKSEGVYATLNVLENLLDFRPVEVASSLNTKTGALKYLLRKLKQRKFDNNKLYSAEILASLLASDPQGARRLGELSGDGVDELLQAAAYYRKRQPASAEEAELVENLFDALASALTTRENQGRFRHSQGFELMVRCMKEKNHAGTCALKVLDFATQNNPTNCEAFVASGGLKVLFPAFMGRGVVKACLKQGSSSKGGKGGPKGASYARVGDKAEAMEAEAAAEASAISVVATLCVQLQVNASNTTSSKTAGDDALPRLVAKFLEEGVVKVDRLAELFLEYSDKVKAFDFRAARGEFDDDDDDDEDDDDQARLYAKRLRAGLYTLQLLAAIAATVVVRSTMGREKLKAKLFEKGRSLNEVRQVLVGYSATLSKASQDADAATKQAAKDEDKARVSTGAEEGELDSGGLGGYALAAQEANALAAKQVSEVASRLASTFPVELQEEESAPPVLDAESVFKAAVAALEAKQGGVYYTTANPGNNFNAAKHVPQVTMLNNDGNGGSASANGSSSSSSEEMKHGEAAKQPQRCKVSVPHGMAEDHFITYMWAKDATSGEMLAGAQLGPEDAPELVFDLPPSQEGVAGVASASVVGYAACNQHGVWQSDAKP